MKPEECVVEDSAVERIVEKYADCTGCRELEQEASIWRRMRSTRLS